MQEEFYRIKRLSPYVFAKVNGLKAEFRSRGVDILGLVENEHRIRQASRDIKHIISNAEKYINKYFQEENLSETGKYFDEKKFLNRRSI